MVYSMWEEKYQAEQDEIKAPEFLKVKALQQMKEAREGSSRKPFKWKPLLNVGLGFVVVVVVFVVLNFSLQEPESVTLSIQVPESVTDIVFERLDGGLRYFTGIGDNDDEHLELEEVESDIGVSGSEFYFEGFHLEDVSWAVDEKDMRIQYFFAREGATIQVMINNHTDSVTSNSILNDFPLALYYRIVLLETTYTAEFLDDEIYYQIEATGLTEEEFIEYLEEMLKY